MLKHIFGLIFSPRKEWEAIGALPESALNKNLPYTIILAVFPAVAWYFGTTQIGWQVDPSAETVTRVSEESALSLAGGFYAALVLSVVAFGYCIHWMSHNYGAKSTPIKGIVIAGFTATPIFLAGIAGFYPIFWFDIILGTAAVCYAVYLLYLGIPIVMKVPQDRGFLYASAIVAVAFVLVIAVMTATVIFWEFISEPEFVS